MSEEFGERFQRQECVHVWMWKEALKGKEEKTQMGLIFNSALVGLSFIYKWIYIYNLADITVSIYGARQSVRAHTNVYLLRLM